MAFRRNFAPAVSNPANVKSLQEEIPVDDGTSKANKVAEDDLKKKNKFISAAELGLFL